MRKQVGHAMQNQPLVRTASEEIGITVDRILKKVLSHEIPDLESATHEELVCQRDMLMAQLAGVNEELVRREQFPDVDEDRPLKDFCLNCASQSVCSRVNLGCARGVEAYRGR